MLGRRSQEIALIPLNPDLGRNLRRSRRTPVEMGDNQRNPHIEENMEYHDARPENEEQISAWNVDFTTSLRELFAPIATSFHSCIVLPPTNATHFVIPQNLYPRIKVILISRIRRICNFIGKFRFNVKDGGN